MLVSFMTILNILLPFGIFYVNWVHFVVIWYIFPILVCLDQEKSGNTGFNHRKSRFLPAIFICMTVCKQYYERLHFFLFIFVMALTSALIVSALGQDKAGQPISSIT
jgi:hypothetical protein